MLRELCLSLRDWRECGNLWGHLVAWWRVVSGRCDPDAPIDYHVTPAAFAGVLCGGQGGDRQVGDRQVGDRQGVLELIADMAPELLDRARAADDPVVAILRAWNDAMAMHRGEQYAGNGGRLDV
jgi:hypothetical protein